MQITTFKGTKPAPLDNSSFDDWNDLCDLMREQSELPCQRKNKLGHLSFIFGRCIGSRNKQNIQFLSGLAADFDIGPDDARYRTFDDVCDMLEAGGFQYIAYTTTKSEGDHHKFRVVLPYARDIAASYCQAAWHKCNNDIFGGAIDPSTKDESRLSFLPADWQGDIYIEPNGDLDYKEKPYQRFRCNRQGAPILSDQDINALSVAGNKSKTIRPWQSTTTVLPVLSAAQLEKLARGHKPDAQIWSSLADINRSPLVTRWMRDELPTIEGNRDYRFMSCCASEAVKDNIPIDVETLLILAEQFSTQKLNRPLPADAMRQAQNALAWAFHNSPSK